LASILSPEVQLGTLVKRFTSPDELHSPNTAKVLLNKEGEAIYFSRAAIPFLRGKEPQEWLKHHTYYKHIGIYADRHDVVAEVTKLPPSSLEVAESLEQLRWLENGYAIKVTETDIETIGVDTPEDLTKAIAALNK